MFLGFCTNVKFIESNFVFNVQFDIESSQPTFTGSKLTNKTPEQCLKPVQS